MRVIAVMLSLSVLMVSPLEGQDLLLPRTLEITDSVGVEPIPSSEPSLESALELVIFELEEDERGSFWLGFAVGAVVFGVATSVHLDSNYPPPNDRYNGFLA